MPTPPINSGLRDNHSRGTVADFLACTERVLNPAAHSNVVPLYEKEIQEALALIKKLEEALVV